MTTAAGSNRFSSVYVVSAARTPIGSFLGVLSDVAAPALGGRAIAAAMERSGVTSEHVDEVYMGNVLSAGVGQAPARQAAIAAGIAHKTPATTVSKVCGSGLQAVILGARAIRLGDADVVVAGGMESMSQAPYVLAKARTGYRMGPAAMVDSMVHDGLWDPYHNFHMGSAGELCARECGYTRQAQDAFALESYRRALQAQKDGAFRDEITPVTVSGKKGSTVVSEDEEPGRGNPEKLPALKPVFSESGTITAANASKLNDGAAALVLASERAVDKHGLQPMARIVAYGGHAQAPEWFTTAPVGAIHNTLSRASLEVQDIELFEINEAFAVVTMACADQAHIDPAKVNVRGGAVALGHPIGASGARILTTLLYSLKDMKLRRGLATLCIGGGEAVAVVVERP
jgi:acetyl-CoA C-acetyltransferase